MNVIEVEFAVGDSIKVISGPLKGFTGVVEKIDALRGKTQVVVSMFGRETPVELDFAQVETL